jgi:hypothetical protein
MKPFHFSLEAVRVLRQRQEKAALEQYASALNAQRQAEERQEAVQKELPSGDKVVEFRLIITRDKLTGGRHS